MRHSILQHCDHCKSHVTCEKDLSLWRCPQILILQLKRFEPSGVKVNTNVEYPTKDLDLSGYMSSSQGMSFYYETASRPWGYYLEHILIFFKTLQQSVLIKTYTLPNVWSCPCISVFIHQPPRGYYLEHNDFKASQQSSFKMCTQSNIDLCIFSFWYPSCSSTMRDEQDHIEFWIFTRVCLT